MDDEAAGQHTARMVSFPYYCSCSYITTIPKFVIAEFIMQLDVT